MSSEARTGTVRAVLLDAFGTLVTLDAPAPRLRALLAERLGAQVSDAEARSALAAEVRYYRAHMASGSDLARVAELRLRCAGVLRQALPPAPALAAAGAAQMNELLLATLEFRAYPEVPATLAKLREGGLRLVVASNWDASLPEVLARVGLLDAVDGVISSAAVGAAKPDPLPLQRALELAGARADQAVHVGDSPAEDLEAARAAGVRAVLVNRAAVDPSGERVDRGIATINSLAALPALLGL